MNIIHITDKNIDLLGSFVSNNLSKHFRYFCTRDYKQVIKQHIYTIVGLLNDKPIAYGHIDYEDRNWLGICVLDEYHGKGYGGLIMRNLIDFVLTNKHLPLYLTVDNDNTKAISLYKKYGFETVRNTDYYIQMIYDPKILDLPVSYGEAFDKLTILDIKMKYIQDDRKLDVKKEYEMIYEKIKAYMNCNSNFYYNILKIINENIWVMQDIFRDSKSIEDKNDLCLKILDENDRRFRVKSKINNLLSSCLKEQKGYKQKKIFVLTHLGLGDMLTSNGMIRYLSTLYEEVVVVCKKQYEENVKVMYQDDQIIKLYPVKDDTEISIYYGFDRNKFMEIVKEYDVLRVGSHIGRLEYNNIPFCFYEDARIPNNVFWDYFHIPDTIESISLYNKIKDLEYIFIHNTSSTKICFTIETIEKHSGHNKDEILFININKNEYNKGHKYYELAEEFVNKLVPYYKDTIINAKKIYVCNSSVFCMCINLNIKTDECYVYDSDFSYLYKNTGFNESERKKFKSF